LFGFHILVLGQLLKPLVVQLSAFWSFVRFALGKFLFALRPLELFALEYIYSIIIFLIMVFKSFVMVLVESFSVEF